MATVVLLAVACHGDERRTGVPADTALRVVTDTTARPDSTAVDSLGPAGGTGGNVTTAGGGAGGETLVLAADSAAGDALYHGRARCFTCHGERGEGAANLGPDLTDTTWVDGGGSLDAIRDAIARGVASPRVSPVAMPAYAGMLTPDEIARTAAYVYTLSHPGSTAADTARTPAAAGAGAGAGAGASTSAHSPGDSTARPSAAPIAGDTTRPPDGT
ncbi:MAG TPA: cytochrome c [Gemmatimonadaceae bacterium]